MPCQTVNRLIIRGHLFVLCVRFRTPLSVFEPADLHFRTKLRSFAPMKEHLLEDKEFGVLHIRENARARRLIFRMREDVLHVTVPPHTSLSGVQRALEELRPRLRAAHARQHRTLIDLNFHITADYIRLCLVSGAGCKFMSRSCGEEVRIVCPSGTDFSDTGLQQWLRRVVTEALRKRALEVLPPLLEQLARRYEMNYGKVRINAATRRWGSCSMRGDINLSLFLMLLPAQLVEYVLLHELAHTREMNHGERFWALLDRLTEGRADALRRELRQYRPSF